MQEIRRGQIWTAKLDPTVGSEIKKTRPVVVISNDINNRYAPTVTILPISDKGDKIYPFEVLLPMKTVGLTKESKVKCQQTRTVDKLRLFKLLGRIGESEVREINEAILLHLGIDDI